MDLSTLLSKVKEKYNIPFELKPEQIKPLEIILKGEECFTFIPTGYGKSLIYMLTPLLMDEVSKLVSVGVDYYLSGGGEVQNRKKKSSDGPPKKMFEGSTKKKFIHENSHHAPPPPDD